MKEKVDARNTFKLIKRTWKYAKNYRKYLFLYAFCSLIMAAISVGVPILSAQLIMNMTKGILDKLLIVAGAMFAVEFLRNTANYFASQFVNKFRIEFLNDIQIDLAGETLNLKVKELDKNSSGIFIDRLSKDANQLAVLFDMITWYMGQMLTNIGVLGAIFIVNKYMFLFSVIVLIILYFIERARIKNWYKYDKEIRKLNEKNSGLIAELVRGLRDVKVLNSAHDFMMKIISRIKEANDKKYEMQIKRNGYTFWYNNARDFSDFLFVGLGIYLVFIGKLSVENLVVIYMYQPRTYSLLYSITSFIEELKKFSLSSSRVFEIIGGSFEKEEFGTKHLTKINGDFEFKNVTFGYEENRDILKNLSFKVNANETVAFVGKSGGGKTTIFSLIDKLYTVTKGEITIDGININELDRDSIRNNISIITQNPYIFNFTIKENLKITKEDATDEELEEVCKIAKLHDFIMTLPDKYDTLIGEGGLNLSGGQRQRLAIARALLKKTEIILFDEATSALDNETQRDIQTAINNMKGEYTILIIAHRLSTVIDSDRIILIDDGKKVAEGSHEQLFKNNKLYRELYQTELK